jgi:hypothetical protein
VPCWTGNIDASGCFQQAAAECKDQHEQYQQNDHWIRHLAGERIGYVNWRQIFLIGRLYDSSKTLRFAKSIYTRNQLCLNMLILTYVPHVEGLISLPPPAKPAECLSRFCVLFAMPNALYTSLVVVFHPFFVGLHVPWPGDARVDHFSL